MATRRLNLPLLLRLLLRRLTTPAGRLAPLTVLSIAISVALGTSLEMSSRSAQVQLNSTAEAIAGAASIEIAAGATGIPEILLETVRGSPGVLAASPLIMARVRVVDRDFPVSIVGIDLLAEQQVRPNSITRHGVEIRDPLRLLALPEAVIATRPLLDRLGIADAWDAGSPARFGVRLGSRGSQLVVEGLLDPRGIAGAFGGQVAAMDIYALQKLVGREGWLDRIDVVPSPGQGIPDLIHSLQERVAGVATVRRSSVRTKFIEDVLDTLRLAVAMFAAVGAIVSCLLTYATMTLSVDRDRRQLAILRAVGMEASRVQRGVFLEATVLALTGTFVGFAAGFLLSGPMLSMLSAFTRQFRAEEILALSIQPRTVAVAALVGLGATLAGCLGPARLAGRRFPLDALEKEVAAEEGSKRGWGVAGVACLAVIIGALSLPNSAPANPTARLAALFIGGLGLLVSLAPTYPRALKLMALPLRKVAPSVGHFVGRSFSARPWSFAIALTAIAGVVAALASIFLLVESMARTLEEWTVSRYPNAIVVTAGSITDAVGRELLIPETMELIRGTDGVEAVDEQYWVRPTILFRGEEVSIAALTMSVVSTHGHLPTIDRPSSEVALSLARGQVAVSTGFSKHFKVFRGDRIRLDTPRGPRTFEVAALVKDYTGVAGSIMLDIEVFDAHWAREGAWAAVVWAKGSQEAVIEEIRRRTIATQDLFFVHGDELLRINRGWVLQFTGLLYVISALVALLGGIAIAILLVATIAERRRELAVLRAAGAEPRHLVALVLIDALTVALLGSTSGLVLGIACAVPMIDILRDVYGWVIEQSWFSAALPLLLLGACAAALVGAIAPARVAYRTLPSEIFAPE